MKGKLKENLHQNLGMLVTVLLNEFTLLYDTAFVEETRLLDSLKIYICEGWFVVEFM